MQGEIISMENAEKIANYDKVITQRNYYKTEYEMLKINYQKLKKENASLKNIISKVNKGNNEKK